MRERTGEEESFGEVEFIACVDGGRTKVVPGGSSFV